MKLAIPALILLCPAVSAARTFERLPPSAFPDTEVSTNVPFAFFRDAAGQFVFDVSFTATPSNNLEVAFGVDADRDGTLAFGETGLAFAWDCGQWFLGNGEGGASLVARPATNAVPKAVSWSLRLAAGAVPRRLALTENGVPLFGELSGNPPAWLYNPEWDMVRVTVRGVDAPEESLSVVVKSDSFILRLR